MTWAGRGAARRGAASQGKAGVDNGSTVSHPFTAVHSDFLTKDWMGIPAYPIFLASGQSLVEMPRVFPGSRFFNSPSNTM